MQFVTAVDAQRRLGNCLIQYENKPFYCRNITINATGGYDMTGYFLGGVKKNITKDITKEVINPPQFKMGFTNVYYNGVPHPVYITRLPRRITQMGLSMDNTRVSSLIPDQLAFAWEQVLLAQPFLNLQQNIFPSITEIKDCSGLAFSDEFAVQKVSLFSARLFHARNAVGEFAIRENTIYLYSPYLYLQQWLQTFFASKGENIRVQAA